MTAIMIHVVALAACAREGADDPRGARSAIDPAQVTEIEIPASLRGLPVGPQNPRGELAVVPCATCHDAPDAAAPLPTSARGIAGPHRGLRLEHGELACGACHHPSDRDALRLADGRAIDLVEAMRLCAQCHGPQARAYRHGAHGGMRGHWDVTEGPRTRNHCVSCHDPHAPAFGSFSPMPPPRDRFLPAPEEARHE